MLNPRMITKDAQQAAFGFLVEQISYIEPTVYKIRYPDIQYPTLIPVDTSAPEWTKSITFFSMDMAGRAAWLHHAAKDLPLADISREKFESAVRLAGIGYRYDLEELAQAMMVGINLPSEKAEAARRAYEEFVDNFLLWGDSSIGVTGLANDANVTVVEAAEVSNLYTQWANKTGDQILQDINDAITGVWVGALQTEMADTILLPPASMAYLATRARAANGNSDMSILDWLMKYNTYTATTGQPLTVRTVRGLETAGTGNAGRMIVYRRDPLVLKAHIPMPHRFMAPWQTGPMTWDIPGIFRLGGLEIRRPKAVRYVDGIVGNLYE